MEDKVLGNSDLIKESIFSFNSKVFVLLAEVESEIVGFALYFQNYSTFLCRHGIYIEDIYVREKFRGFGIGKKFFKEICKIAKEKNFGRVEWWCLNWNKPSIDFYIKMGAEPMKDWTVYRLQKEEISLLSE